ncbi:MAG: MFS transporter, partial [Bacillota bacterium]
MKKWKMLTSNWGSMMVLLFSVIFLLRLAIGLQTTAFNNFANDIVGVSPAQLGLVQSIREVPGLLTVALIGAVTFMSHSTVVGLCGLMVAAGLVWFGLTTTFAQMIGATLVMSIGFHMLHPMQSAMVLSLSNRGQKGLRMGQFSGAQAGATLLAIVIVYAVAEWFTGQLYYQIIFWTAALLAAVAGVLMLVRGRASGEVRIRVPAFVFRRQYMSFYILRLLTASQRHVFSTFAVFLVVHEYGVSVQTVAVLMAVSNGLAIFVRPLIGRLVDLWGTRTTLVLGYSVATGTALTYAFVQVLMILYVAYCLDTLVTGMETAVSVHLDDIADDADVAPSLAMGSTINHILGLIIPVIGGALWSAIGYHATFTMAAV